MAPPAMNTQTQADDRCEHPPKSKRIHFLLIPIMAQGHMIPMLDLARLLASRGSLVTFVTTPLNLARIRPLADIAAASSLPLRFVPLPFPTAAAGLPDGCESIELVPTLDLFLPFMRALFLLRDPLEAYLRVPDPDQWPPPACIISDTVHHWTSDFARSLAVPRLSFKGPSCFYITCSLLLERHKDELQSAAAGGMPFLIPGLPQPIWVTKNQTGTWQSEPTWDKIAQEIRVADAAADGVVSNTFEELEPWYLASYRRETGKPVWPVGPLSLYKEAADAKAARGRSASVNRDLVLRWLDDREPRSVVLVSFGSIARNTLAQLTELGCGLEASGRAFVWVVKEAAESEAAAQWAIEMEDRCGDKGLIVKGWIPQVTVLSHGAVGGFLTHCGWNSTLEAVAAGVPMATWPHFADQFMNERLVVDVLRIGVEVGVREPTALVVREGCQEEVKVGRAEVERAVVRLMDAGREGEEMMERARELKENARKAMEEGGSSWQSLENIIDFAIEKNKNVK